MASIAESSATEVITRVLFAAPLVHVYAIPPLQSNRGHVASAWTSSPQNEIFTARIRIIETSDPSQSTTNSNTSLRPPASASGPGLGQPTKYSLSVSILLEDGSTGDLFAAAPYTTPSAVEATIDSSRFFALRVTGEGGRKAVLGIGFEERSEALDFSIALQEARKVLGLEAVTPSTPSTPVTPRVNAAPVTPRSAGLGPGGRNVRAVPGRARPEAVAASVPPAAPGREDVPAQHVKRDWSLKEGQMLHVDIGGRSGDVVRSENSAIEPPSGGGLLSATKNTFSLLPPPPSAREVREEQKKRSDDGQGESGGKSLEDLGFDDGEFGEFQ